MSLVIGTILWVIILTALIGIAGYVVDRSTARREHKE